MDQVVLVNQSDTVLGVMEKQLAHKTATLHRAFSVFIFNDNNELLIQQRAKNKYHSPALWTNACCSHPKLNETNIEGAKRRLKEELGIICSLVEKFYFIYKADVGDGLWEHELDYVFAGKYTQQEIPFNNVEVMAVKWIKINDLQNEIKQYPQKYTEWFKIIFKEYYDKLILQ